MNSSMQGSEGKKAGCCGLSTRQLVMLIFMVVFLIVGIVGFVFWLTSSDILVSKDVWLYVGIGGIALGALLLIIFVYPFCFGSKSVRMRPLQTQQAAHYSYDYAAVESGLYSH